MKKFLFNFILPYILYVVIFLWCWSIRKSPKKKEAEDFDLYSGMFDYLVKTYVFFNPVMQSEWIRRRLQPTIPAKFSPQCLDYVSREIKTLSRVDDKELQRRFSNLKKNLPQLDLDGAYYAGSDDINEMIRLIKS